MKLFDRFINRDDVDFDVVESYTPVQTWELVEGSDDVVEYATRLEWEYIKSMGGTRRIATTFDTTRGKRGSREEKGYEERKVP